MLLLMRHPERVAFLRFLVPGVPNGIVPYLFAETRVTLPRYLLAVVAGSTPSAFFCVFVGDRLSQGNYSVAIVLAVVVVIIIAVVLAFQHRIMARITTTGD